MMPVASKSRCSPTSSRNWSVRWARETGSTGAISPGTTTAGRSAAQAGVALRALVDLYLSAAWRLWRHLPEVIDAERNPAAVVQAGEVMLRAADDVVAALAEGYQLARRDLVSTQVAARREFVDDLLSGGTQALAGLVERAGLFGLSLVGPHAVLVVQAEQPFTDSSPLTRMLERSIMGAKADADALVSTKDGALVVVFAAPDRRAVDGVISGLKGALPSDEPATGVRLHRTAPVGAWRIGVGGAHQGPGGVRLSYEQAQEALELGLRFGRQERVLDAADMLMHRVLVRDDTAMRELVHAVLHPLTTARGGAEPLLRTLEAYFEANGNASLAARSLHLSVRAMTYRLAKSNTLPCCVRLLGSVVLSPKRMLSEAHLRISFEVRRSPLKIFHGLMT